MLLREVIAADGKIYLKSEFEPISDEWPAVSFTKNSVGARLRGFNPERDIIIYVGTSRPENTPNPAHRQRLLSAIQIEPNAIHDTRDLVPAESWANWQENYRGRWGRSFAVLRAWQIVGFPSAYEVTAAAYSRLGLMENLGNVVELHQNERTAILDLTLEKIDLRLQPTATGFDNIRAFLNLESAIKQEIARMRARLLDRERSSGTVVSYTNPVRRVESDIDILLGEKWREQQARCSLCDGALVLAATNRLLQCSVDRIDSGCGSYDSSNLQITHLACNLAKNSAGAEEFDEWLSVVRGNDWLPKEDPTEAMPSEGVGTKQPAAANTLAVLP